MAKKKVYPPLIYVVRDGPDDEPYLATFEEPHGAIECAQDGGSVAVYRLCEIREASITHVLKK